MYICNGDVAQLGERLNGIQEAKSSILFISTRNFSRLCQAGGFFHICCKGRVTHETGYTH